MVEQRRTIWAIAADEHCGSPVGLFPPGTWALADQSPREQSPGQKIIWQQWCEGWELVAALMRKVKGQRPRLIIANAGDATEGNHHSTTQLITGKPVEQQQLHIACMRHALTVAGFDQAKGDELHYICGTPAHVGPAGDSEESIARALLNKSGTDGKYTAYRLLRRTNGVLFDVAHQGPGPGTRSWTRSTALLGTLKALYLDCLEAGRPVPRYFIRAHRHSWVTADVRKADGTTAIDGFLLPSFTLKSEYANQVASTSPANIGMLIVVVEADGSTHWQCPMITVHDEVIDD